MEVLITITNLRKMHFLPKIHQKLYGQSVSSNCDKPTGMPECLDYHLKPLMHSAKSSITESYQ